MELFAIQINTDHFNGAGLVFVMAIAIIGGLIGLCLRDPREVRQARSVHHRAMTTLIELYPEISPLLTLKDKVRRAIEALLISEDGAEERHFLARALRDTDALAAEIGKKYPGVLDLLTVRDEVNEAVQAWFERRCGEANHLVATVMQRFDIAIASVVKSDPRASCLLSVARTAERVMTAFQTRSADGDKERDTARHELEVAREQLEYALSNY